MKLVNLIEEIGSNNGTYGVAYFAPAGDGTVVRTDKAHNTAGIQFNNIDQFTSSMILYLGMMNGKQ